jgi:hypothetical protein
MSPGTFRQAGGTLTSQGVYFIIGFWQLGIYFPETAKYRMISLIRVNFRFSVPGSSELFRYWLLMFWLEDAN